MFRSLIPALLLQGAALPGPPGKPAVVGGVAALAPRARTIVVDARLASDAHWRIGDTLLVRGTPTGPADTVVVGAIMQRGADPSEVARDEYRVLMHLDQLQAIIGYGDRVDRFAVATRDSAGAARALRVINDAAFGFRAYRSREIAAETSQTFLVVSRFHRAIGAITIVASAVFLLCIMLLKVDERRRDVAALRLTGISSATVLKSVMLEATLLAVAGSAVGVGVGWLASVLVNRHYQAFYRTTLTFSLITPGVVTLAVALSLLLGVVAGFLAGRRLTRVRPLTLLGR